MHPAKVILNFINPVLKPLYKWYSSRTRSYTYEQIRISVKPGVFHPGLFFSTKTLVAFLKTLHLQDKTVLELGAGTGLLAIFCKLRGASIVTASDISDTALLNIRENAEQNNVTIHCVKSDLFDELQPNAFDIVLINPPFYPRAALREEEQAWYCGADFEYFRKLFSQLAKCTVENDVFMVLSSDCDTPTISKIAQDQGLMLTSVYKRTIMGEVNCVYAMKRLT